MKNWGYAWGKSVYSSRNIYTSAYSGRIYDYTTQGSASLSLLPLEYRAGLGGKFEMGLLGYIPWIGLGTKYQLYDVPKEAMAVEFNLATNSNISGTYDINSAVIFTKTYGIVDFTSGFRAGFVEAGARSGYACPYGRYNYFDIFFGPNLNVRKDLTIFLGLNYRMFSPSEFKYISTYSSGSTDQYIDKFENFFSVSLGFRPKELPGFDGGRKSKKSETESHFTKAINYMNADLYADAIVELKYVTDSEPKNAGAYEMLGNCYYIKGINEKALENYYKALELNPGNIWLKEWIGKIKPAEEPKTGQ